MIIKDSTTKPFLIKTNGESFDLYEEKEIQDGKRAGENTEINRGYFISLESAVQRMVQLKVSNGDEVVSLSKYVEAYKETTNKLLLLTGK